MEKNNITNLSRKEELFLIGLALAGALAKNDFSYVAASEALEAVDDLKRLLKEREEKNHCE